MNQFLLGGTAVASAFAGLVLFRFWGKTRDRFFIYFAASLWIEAGHRLAMGLFPAFTEENPLSYAVRIVAYGLILFAIYEKNRRSRT